MIDLCLRAGNAGALASACPFLRGEDDDLRCTEEIAEMVPETIIITPETPKRIWA
ncbi:hypothetical protein ABID21_001938 [Pseudorhizobium tarimense]|uniref:Uncharacterized protein n=1 Tax=Pseudorhizobium tarimense TaxID=1079109 RepID=A0ABV2H5N4_9HYPH|nr:hypothetical protein [Pseudorhizobium tarimense]MCJ8519030.1 hypothetical protein [Pseudorhizobium tarimense]